MEQGDVESIASKNPKELTSLLEQISGSDELKKDYEELEEQKARAEEKSALIYQEKRTVVMERKQKKAQKEEAEKHLRLQEELVCIIPFFICSYLLHLAVMIFYIKVPWGLDTWSKTLARTVEQIYKYFIQGVFISLILTI